MSMRTGTRGRVGIVAAVAVGAVLTAGTAGASPERSGANHDFTVGHGSFANGSQHFSYSARNATGSSLSPASGYFVTRGVTSAQGPVTCLDVEGNRAGFIYPIKKSNPPAPPGTAIMISVQDNSATGQPDQIGFLFVPAALTTCPPAATPFTVSGDIAVHDAPSQ